MREDAQSGAPAQLVSQAPAANAASGEPRSSRRTSLRPRLVRVGTGVALPVGAEGLADGALELLDGVLPPAPPVGVLDAVLDGEDPPEPPVGAPEGAVVGAVVGALDGCEEPAASS